MKRILTIPLLLLCACLVGTTAALLVTPPPALAQSQGQASCGTYTVYCYAYHCECVNNHGCVGRDQNGNVVSTKYCSTGAGMEESQW
jgi:hypothetical protein